MRVGGIKALVPAGGGGKFWARSLPFGVCAAYVLHMAPTRSSGEVDSPAHHGDLLDGLGVPGGRFQALADDVEDVMEHDFRPSAGVEEETVGDEEVGCRGGGGGKKLL